MNSSPQPGHRVAKIRAMWRMLNLILLMTATVHAQEKPSRLRYPTPDGWAL